MEDKDKYSIDVLDEVKGSPTTEDEDEPDAFGFIAGGSAGSSSAVLAAGGSSMSSMSYALAFAFAFAADAWARIADKYPSRSSS